MGIEHIAMYVMIWKPQGISLLPFLGADQMTAIIIRIPVSDLISSALMTAQDWRS